MAIVDDFAREYRDRLENILGSSTDSPLSQLRQYFPLKITDMAACDCTERCLIGNLAQELSPQNELFRDRLNQVFAEWEEYL